MPIFHKKELQKTNFNDYLNSPQGVTALSQIFNTCYHNELTLNPYLAAKNPTKISNVFLNLTTNVERIANQEHLTMQNFDIGDMQSINIKLSWK